MLFGHRVLEVQLREMCEMEHSEFVETRILLSPVPVPTETLTQAVDRVAPEVEFVAHVGSLSGRCGTLVARVR